MRPNGTKSYKDIMLCKTKRSQNPVIYDTGASAHVASTKKILKEVTTLDKPATMHTANGKPKVSKAGKWTGVGDALFIDNPKSKQRPRANLT